MEKLYRSRRQFLLALMSGMAGLWCLSRYLSPLKKTGVKSIVLTKAHIPEEGALVYRQARLAIVREKGECYALGLVCTHLGCTVTVTPRELVCPCHGSRFDRNGAVLSGPADRPLPRYPVVIGEESIIVQLPAGSREQI